MADTTKQIKATGGHTPTPWKFDDTLGCRSIKGGKSGPNPQGRYTEVAYTVGLHDDDVDRANAKLIVDAVNAYDAQSNTRAALADCAMRFAEIAATDPKSKGAEIARNGIALIDAALNPDGESR